MSVIPFRKEVKPMVPQHVCPHCVSAPCVCSASQPFGYAYIGHESGGHTSVELKQFRTELTAGTREFPAYLEPQVRYLLTSAFLAGVREACPSRWPEVRDTSKQSVIALATAYADKILGGAQ